MLEVVRSVGAGGEMRKQAVVGGGWLREKPKIEVPEQHGTSVSLSAKWACEVVVRSKGIHPRGLGDSTE